jgi:ABC-2 type transport system permease protein
MSALSIALKDMWILLKNRGALIQLFLMPLIFTLGFIGLAVAGQGAEEARTITLVVVNNDAGGPMADEFINALNESGGLETILTEESAGMDQLEAEEIDRLLIIPAGFSASVDTSETSVLRLIDRQTNAPESETVRLAVQGVARELSLQHNILASLEQMGQMQAANPSAIEAFGPERTMAQARSQFERSRTQPLIAVTEINPAALAKEEEELNYVALAVPGWAVLFMFLTAQVTARSIYDEKKIGSFRRLLAAPISKMELLTGKLLPNFLTVILQTIIIFGASILFLPLLGIGRMTLGEDPLALILLVMAIGLCSTTLGIAIAAFAHTEAQIGGISAVVLWVAGFLGGALVRLYQINDFLATVSKVVPQYWAIVGFDDLLVRNGHLPDITDSLLALLAFSIAFLLIGLWRFDFE